MFVEKQITAQIYTIILEIREIYVHLLTILKAIHNKELFRCENN